MPANLTVCAFNTENTLTYRPGQFLSPDALALTFAPLFGRYRGTSVAADGAYLILNKLEKSSQDHEYANLNFEITGPRRAKIREAKVLIEQLGVWRQSLDEVCLAHITTGFPSPMNKTLDLILLHFATNMCQYLQKYGKVLIPTDINVAVPSLKGAGAGHASLLYIEKIGDRGHFNVHLFETSGYLGGKYGSDDIVSYCDRVKKKALLDAWIQARSATPRFLADRENTSYGV